MRLLIPLNHFFGVLSVLGALSFQCQGSHRNYTNDHDNSKIFAFKSSKLEKKPQNHWNRSHSYRNRKPYYWNRNYNNTNYHNRRHSPDDHRKHNYKNTPKTFTNSNNYEVVKRNKGRYYKEQYDESPHGRYGTTQNVPINARNLDLSPPGFHKPQSTIQSNASPPRRSYYTASLSSEKLENKSPSKSKNIKLPDSPDLNPNRPFKNSLRDNLIKKVLEKCPGKLKEDLYNSLVVFRYAMLEKVEDYSKKLTTEFIGEKNYWTILQSIAFSQIKEEDLNDYYNFFAYLLSYYSTKPYEIKPLGSLWVIGLFSCLHNIDVHSCSDLEKKLTSIKMSHDSLLTLDNTIMDSLNKNFFDENKNNFNQKEILICALKYFKEMLKCFKPSPNEFPLYIRLSNLKFNKLESTKFQLMQKIGNLLSEKINQPIKYWKYSYPKVQRNLLKKTQTHNEVSPFKIWHSQLYPSNLKMRRIKTEN